MVLFENLIRPRLVVHQWAWRLNATWSSMHYLFGTAGPPVLASGYPLHQLLSLWRTDYVLSGDSHA